MSTIWTVVPHLAISPTSNYIAFGDKSILSAPCTSTGNPQGIHIYKTQSKKWKVFIKYPEHFKSTNHTIAICPKSNTAYLYGTESLLQSFTLPTAFSSKSSLKAYDGKSYNINVNKGTSLIVIDRDVHLIGGETNTKHFVWNHKGLSWQEIFQFSTLKTGNKNHQTIYLKNKGMLFYNILNQYCWSNT